MEKPNFQGKKYSLCFRLSGKRKKILRTIFEYFDLDGLKEQLDYWKYAALVNEIGMYDSGNERRQLIEFCADLEKVIEVFYVMSKHKKKQLQRIPAEYKKEWKKFNRCAILTKNEKSNLEGVLKMFSEKHIRLYALAEVTDMLEAVVTLKEPDDRNRHSSISFFLCINALLNLIYT
ncbi:hypothetical protein [Chitinophaga sp. sic0106]|uniref:hypothetical protein n=1 Tax=Chitinophaga sp. sic0106 TaxID=2854785 RepID=UPI001C43F4E1|nr:hypothetical protein [Chitinophaga sp. sic0106]MBV7530411.1 hypothetical protein [Chitinophaga sp. sic0106]